MGRNGKYGRAIKIHQQSAVVAAKVCWSDSVQSASGDVLGPKSGDDAAVEDGDVHLAEIVHIQSPLD